MKEVNTKNTEELNFNPYLSFIITNNCNFRCRYCTPTDGGMGEGVGTKDEKVEVEDITAKIKIAEEKGITKFRLTGGEPFVFKGSIPVLQFLESNTDKDYVVSTNGSLLHRHEQELSELERVKLRVSLDSVNKENFNQISQTKLYEQTISNIRTFANSGKIDRLSMVVTNENFDEVIQVMDFCEDLGIGLKLLDVYQTPETKEFWRSNYTPLDKITDILANKAFRSNESRYTKRFGIPSMDYHIGSETDSIRVRVKDSRAGTRYSSEYCSDCSIAPCQEGLYNILHATDGSILPCRFSPTQLPGKSLEDFRNSIEQVINIYQKSHLNCGFWRSE